MCMFSQPEQKAPVLPPENAAMRLPDGDAIKSTTGRRTEDRVKAGANTILTSGSGVTTAAPTDKKTLLGQ
ncbi:hypothetical protein HB779_17420 [Phyllobacterium sp. 628]|uniref:hypothetical protein n=1 Tax=Phyllobacterium sp. 628 TaxID=2718938 RepID=UPI0016623EDF|nr:hypothetical protein [Phyllobacterium sp. 628]QND53468.1 hypothetical protein HB779_17420 [Phyllobacterium sp. 628]